MCERGGEERGRGREGRMCGVREYARRVEEGGGDRRQASICA